MPAQRSTATRHRVECDECGETFRGSYELNRHVVLHSQNKSKLMLKCPFPGCPHSTLQKTNLQTHYIAKHLKLKIHKCTIVDDCTADFSDRASLNRHQKNIHGYHCKEKVFRPVKPSTRKARAQPEKSTVRRVTEIPTQEELAAMQSFELACSTPSASSPSGSSSSGSDFDFFSPSPSPDFPSPNAFQLDYPQYSIYPDPPVAAIGSAVAFDPTTFYSLPFDSFPDPSLAGLFTPDFMQGCSAQPSLLPPACYGSPDLLVPDFVSFGMPPSTSVMGFASPEAKEEWLSLLPEPTLAELQSHSIPVSPSPAAVANDVADGGNLDFEFTNITTDFNQFLKQLGIEGIETQPLSLF